MSPPGPSGRTTAALEPLRGESRREILGALGRKIADESGVVISQNRLNRLVCRYVASASMSKSFPEWLSSRLTYADPVGEKATTNVLDERGF